MFDVPTIVYIWTRTYGIVQIFKVAHEKCEIIISKSFSLLYIN